MSSSPGVKQSRRSYYLNRNKKLSKQHIPYLRLPFQDNHGWARYRELYCTHRKCGFLQRVDSRDEARQAGKLHLRIMAAKKARKKAKKLRKKGAKV